MLKPNIISSPNIPTLLENITCVYCGKTLRDGEITKEHVIGRRFVPKGKLNGQWNLIVRACRDCNKTKSDFEDDLSAISMQSDAWGRHAQPDQILANEAKRKAEKSTCRVTGKRIKDSAAKFRIKAQVSPNFNMTLDMSAPPQAYPLRVYQLSRLQLMAFFYFITYDNDRKKGGFWPGFFFPFLVAPRSDWGNSVHKGFMNAVRNWDPKFLIVTADGFFKATIRRLSTSICWSWAIEWNHQYRIVGFFGEREPVENVVSGIQKLEIVPIADNQNWAGYRQEIQLAEEEDRLFIWNE